MKRICSSCVSAMVLTLVFLCQTSWAAQIYVMEAREIALRSGPSAQSALVAKIPMGSPVEVLKTRDDWSRIRYSASSGNTEGWVPSKSLGARPPKDKELETENVTLKEKVATLQNEKSELAQREKELTEKLQSTSERLRKVESDYEKLASGSTNYLKVKSDYDSAKAALVTAQESVQALMQENENLRLSEKIWWVVTGAGFVLAGWLIGLIMGRSQRKRRATYRM